MARDLAWGGEDQPRVGSGSGPEPDASSVEAKMARLERSALASPDQGPASSAGGLKDSSGEDESEGERVDGAFNSDSRSGHVGLSDTFGPRDEKSVSPERRTLVAAHAPVSALERKLALLEDAAVRTREDRTPSMSPRPVDGRAEVTSSGVVYGG